MDIYYDITNQYEKDLRKLSVANQEKVEDVINKTFEFYTINKILPSTKVYRPCKVKLPHGIESSLFVLRIPRDIRIIFSIDEDVLYNKIVVTLFRAVRRDKLEASFDSIIESIYQWSKNTLEE